MRGWAFLLMMMMMIVRMNMMNMMMDTMIMLNEYDEFDNDISAFPLWLARAQSCQYQIRLRSHQWRGNPIRSYNVLLLSQMLWTYGTLDLIVFVFLFCFSQDQLFPFPPWLLDTAILTCQNCGFKGFTRRMYSHSAHYSSHLHRYQGGNKSTVFASRQIPPKLWLIAQFIVPLCVLWLPTGCTFLNLMMSTLALLFDKPMHHICHFFHADACCGSERDKSKRTPLVEFCQL